MSTPTSCACPLRSFQIPAAARPLAAMLACAAAATRNDDGSCGSAPLSVTASSADISPPANVQRSVRMSRGACMAEFQSCRAQPCLFAIRIKQDVDRRDKSGDDRWRGAAAVGIARALHDSDRWDGLDDVVAAPVVGRAYR